MASLVRKITKFRKQEIDQLFSKARRVLKHDGLHLLKAPRQLDFGRILIIVPKRVGNAPTRNKLRRQIKAIFYENKLHEQEFDWIAIVKPPATHLTFAHLQELFLQALQNDQ